MNRVSNGLLMGVAAGLAAGGAYLAATKKGCQTRKRMKKNAAKTMKTISGLVEEVSAMLR